MTVEAPARSAHDLPLVRSRMVGSLRIHALEAGMIRLDGGAMFGVVPRPLWEQRIPPDDRNRIALSLRCLLVEAPDVLVLIDTGAGNKGSEKFRDIYGVENDGNPTRLEEAIRSAGFQPHDVDVVLDTHLHFDHAGGNTVEMPDGSLVPAFPGARYVVQEGEFDFAHRNNDRIRASYRAGDMDPIRDAGLWDFVDGEVEIVPGIGVLPTPGHTPHHHSVLLESDGEKACFLADVCPTSAHLRPAWVMGYDLEPLRTMEAKEGLWKRALDEEWLLIFQHDASVPWGRLDPDSPDPMLKEESDHA
ncbi:MAG: MBL fold metallo-hydrolase [Gemmatimonadota bacterium]